MAGKFTGWLLLSDFDDTLRPEGAEGPVSQADREALEFFMAEGGLFTIATGRDLGSYLTIRDCFPHNASAIVSNGAVIADRRGEILWESFLPENCREALEAMLSAFPAAGAEVHRGREAVLVRTTAAARDHLRHLGGGVREAEGGSIPLPWNKIVLVFPGSLSGRCPEAHAAAARINERLPGLSAVPSGALVDVVRAGSDKGQAAAVLCRRLGVDPARLAAVGDSWNDLPLLRSARYAFAPANAAGEVRRHPSVRTAGECGVCLRDVVKALETEAK